MLLHLNTDAGAEETVQGASGAHWKKTFREEPSEAVRLVWRGGRWRLEIAAIFPYSESSRGPQTSRSGTFILLHSDLYSLNLCSFKFIFF